MGQRLHLDWERIGRRMIGNLGAERRVFGRWAEHWRSQVAQPPSTVAATAGAVGWGDVVRFRF